MPLDPNIILGGQPVQTQSPLETLTAVAQLHGLRELSEARRIAAEKARRDAADDAKVQQILTESGGDMELALPRLRQVVPKAALDFEKTIAETKKEQQLSLQNEMTARIKGLEFAGTLASLAVDERSARTVNGRLRQMSSELAPYLPGENEPYDPARWQQFGDLALSAKDRYEKSQADLKLLSEGKVQEAVASSLSRARNQEELDAKLKGLMDLHVPKSILAQFPTTYSPENMALAARLGITPSKEAELAGQAEGRAQTAAHQKVIESQGVQRIAIARQRLAQGKGSDEDRTALMQAVIENPGLWDQITPTERGKIAGDLNAQGFTGFGKPLSDAAVKQISDSTSAIASLKDLREVLKKNEQYIGPIAGLQALNPYSAARQAQADIDRVRQRVGKALEGGVLRKEDEEKYKKILATLSDVPETALYKIDRLIEDINRDVETYKHQQRLSGRRVPAMDTKSRDPMGIR